MPCSLGVAEKIYIYIVVHEADSPPKMLSARLAYA